MTGPVDVIVAIPAHNERELIGSCLRSVLAAVRAAQREGAVDRARVGVAAHQCTDETARRARHVLAGRPDVDGGVHEDLMARTVGEVRHTLIDALATSRPARGQVLWVFSTDADSSVPEDWITSSLGQADSAGAAVVVGLVELVDWDATPSARLEYERIITAGMRPDGHDHVYGANLAVRLDAYRSVGGFPSVDHGEDHELVQRLRAARWPVLTTQAPVVRTSGRMPGRAAHGLGAMLRHLGDGHGPCQAVEPVRAQGAGRGSVALWRSQPVQRAGAGMSAQEVGRIRGEGALDMGGAVLDISPSAGDRWLHRGRTDGLGG